MFISPINVATPKAVANKTSSTSFGQRFKANYMEAFSEAGNIVPDSSYAINERFMLCLNAIKEFPNRSKHHQLMPFLEDCRSLSEAIAKFRYGNLDLKEPWPLIRHNGEVLAWIFDNNEYDKSIQQCVSGENDIMISFVNKEDWGRKDKAFCGYSESFEGNPILTQYPYAEVECYRGGGVKRRTRNAMNGSCEITLYDRNGNVKTTNSIWENLFNKFFSWGNW